MADAVDLQRVNIHASGFGNACTLFEKYTSGAADAADLVSKLRKLPAGTRILRARLRVHEAANAGSVDIGYDFRSDGTDDPDALFDGIAVNATGTHDYVGEPITLDRDADLVLKNNAVIANSYTLYLWIDYIYIGTK